MGYILRSLTTEYTEYTEEEEEDEEDEEEEDADYSTYERKTDSDRIHKAPQGDAVG